MKPMTTTITTTIGTTLRTPWSPIASRPMLTMAIGILAMIRQK
jgi:hypothetical protein